MWNLAKAETLCGTFVNLEPLSVAPVCGTLGKLKLYVEPVWNLGLSSVEPLCGTLGNLVRLFRLLPQANPKPH